MKNQFRSYDMKGRLMSDRSSYERASYAEVDINEKEGLVLLFEIYDIKSGLQDIHYRREVQENNVSNNYYSRCNNL